MMPKIIYLKDILLAKVEKKNKKERPKLRPFRHEALLKSSLVRKNKKKEDEKQNGL
jgi:hypothetical protein